MQDQQDEHFYRFLTLKCYCSNHVNPENPVILSKTHGVELVGVPHSGQNLAPGNRSLPHLAHLGTAIGMPHSRQNFAADGTGFAHFAQVMVAVGGGAVSGLPQARQNFNSAPGTNSFQFLAGEIKHPRSKK